jgi:predicted regulator of Ras-like GTPase activity (Roadblock/LC7/MglB family)
MVLNLASQELKDDVGRHLSDFRRNAPGVLAAALCHVQGVPIATNVREKESFLMSSMAALLSEAASRGLRRLRFGDMEGIMVYGTRTNVYVRGVPGTEAILIVGLEKGANLGLVLLQVERLLAGLHPLLD